MEQFPTVRPTRRLGGAIVLGQEALLDSSLYPSEQTEVIATRTIRSYGSPECPS
jgi:hypothetical protein